jgi:DNA repair protein RadD
VDKSDITKACVDEIIEHGTDRKKWLVFTAGVEHCTHVRDEIRSRGVSCEMVTGKTPNIERKRILKDYKDGDLRCVVNVACLTTGFNNPAIDLLAYMRPCRSAVLYVQTMGRCLRTAPEKKTALVLDFGDVVATLGPVDKIDIKQPSGGGTGDAPVKVCPKCESVCYAGCRVCPDCGHVFDFNKATISRKPGNAPVLSTQEDVIETHPVVGMELREHAKYTDATAPHTLCVTYFIAGEQKFSEYVCFNHTGYAREKAEKWHATMCPDRPCPRTVADAISVPYPIPTAITVKPDGKYWRVIGYEWPEAPPF